MKSGTGLRVLATYALLGALLGIPLTVQANVTVTMLDDSGPGSLRQAIADAVSGDTIDFAVTGMIRLTTGGLIISKDLSIAGPGPDNLTVSGNNSYGVFNLSSGQVAISGLTIADGNAWNGGAIQNSAHLTLTRCHMRSNRSGSGGGAICNFNVCSITGCTIADSHAAGNDGGGIYNGAELYVTNSTIAYNHTSYNGGAIKVGYVGAITRLISCTIAYNSADSSAGGIWASAGAGAVYIRNTILASNTAPDSPDGKGSFVSQDYNLVGDASGMSIYGSTTHNIYGQDPRLGQLDNLGGPTPVLALRFDSPAVNAGRSDGLICDQRGYPRPVDFAGVPKAEGGDGSDIGAYEMSLDTQMAIFTAVEVEFGASLGRTYRVESSTELQTTWIPVETGIVGTGGVETRLYSVRAIPRRFFRAVQE